LTEAAGGIIGRFHDLATRGAIDDAEARRQAAEALRSMRYGDNDYFFVFDYGQRFVMHGAKKELEGSSGADLRAPNGQAIVADILNAARSGPRGGVVAYPWAKPGKDKPVGKISYVAEFKPWGWVYGTGIYVDDVEAEFRHEAGMALLIISIAAGLLIVVSIAVGRSILRQLGGEPAHASAVALRIAEGDLSHDIDARRSAPDSLMASMAAMQGRLRELMSGINGLAGELARNAGQLSAGAAEIRQASGEQASSTSATAASVEQMTVSINEVSQIAAATEKSSTATAEFAEKGRGLVADSVEEIERVSETVARSSARIRELESRSQEIGGIADVIREIAEQTNLLALNAAIEAARAGEQGRGFAVVADEVRKLAERTAKATSEIGRMIVGVREHTTQAVGSMDEAIPQVRGGLDKAREARAMLESIHREALQSQGRIHDVATATREQATVANDIARHIERIATMTEETHATVGSNAASAAQLERMAGELRQAVGHFRVS
jgi:methyl-accepting chemotaxis protein